MKILGMKPGHDGTLALIDAQSRQLEFSIEAEKDSYPRYEVLHPELLVLGGELADTFPDVVAVSGWNKRSLSTRDGRGVGYLGHADDAVRHHRSRMFGRDITYFTSSHERSHLWCAYALSPFAQGQPCYALVWEGELGDFYFIDEQLRVEKIGQVMSAPGKRYALLYSLADPGFAQPRGKFRHEDAGKLMALCAYGESGPMTPEEVATSDALLGSGDIGRDFSKQELRHLRHHDIGLTHPEFTRLAKRHSDRIFEQFRQFAELRLQRGLPLLIAGGCGLNCDWNTAWRNSGLFSAVFAPPCTNDTGSSIGTAVDAMREFTGQAKLSWDVYCDREFVDDRPAMPDVTLEPLDLGKVAKLLADGAVVAWTHGRCEMGPRALGHRSLLAAPFTEAMRDRLNAIKKREPFRPIAPLCLEEDVAEHFDWQGPSPHMLFFQKVRNAALRAVTHVDGTARVQTVREATEARVWRLLREFRAVTGAGVLCNTSLNFNGAGFINRTSDLHAYCRMHGIDAFVYGDVLARFKVCS